MSIRAIRPGLLRRGALPSGTLPLVLVGLIVLAIGAVLVRDLAASNRRTREMQEGSRAGLALLNDLQYQTQEARRSVLYALTTTDSNLHVEYADQSRAADARVAAMIADEIRRSVSPTVTAGVQRFAGDWSVYLAVRDRVIASILEGAVKEAVDLDLRAGAPAFDTVRGDLLAIKNLFEQQSNVQLIDLEAASNRLLYRLLGILLLMQVFVIIAVRAMQKGRMLQAVRESETRLRGIIGSINEGMFVTDRGGQVKLWNPVMQRSFGRSSADAVGLPVKDIFGGGNAEPLLGAILVATRTGIAGQLSEFADEDADGEARVTRRASSRSNGA